MYVGPSGTFNAKAAGTVDTHDAPGGGSPPTFVVGGDATFNNIVGAGNTFTFNVELITTNNNFNVQSGSVVTAGGSDLKGSINITAGAQLYLASIDPNPPDLLFRIAAFLSKVPGMGPLGLTSNSSH